MIPHDARQATAETLRERIAMSLAIDDAMATELGLAAAALVSQGDHDGARILIDAARSHRVGAIKHRALMWAEGLEI